MKLRAGDWVEVKTKEEILATLDSRGRLDGLPFMPQMLQYCGQRFQVFKRAHKTCDTVNQSGGRRLPGGIHLDLRCDGAAYGGCQAACLIFWKEDWLRPVDAADPARPGDFGPESRSPESSRDKTPCTEADLWAGTRAEDDPVTHEPRYRCQATQLPYFTTRLPWWDIRQYVEDYTSGNANLDKILRGFIYAGYNGVINAGIKLGRPLRWLYDKVQILRGGLPYPRKRGTIPAGKPTPTEVLDLQPGELVRVKSYPEILATLDTANKNRGLYFDAEAVPFCGRTFRVRSRLNRFIDEKTGKLVITKNPSILLDGVCCQARYSECRMFCPRSIYTWWRESWLERVT